MGSFRITGGIGRKLVTIGLGLALASTVSISLAFGALRRPPVNAGYETTYGPVANFSPGYWKNHEDATAALLPQLLGTYKVDTFEKAHDVLSHLGCGDPLDCLAGMVLAAELNLANGGSSCIVSNGVLANAGAFLADHGYAGLGTYTLTKPDNKTAKHLHDELSAYNIDGIPTC